MAGKSRKAKSKISEELHAKSRELKRALFQEAQYKPKVIPNKKKDIIRRGFKDEW